MPSHKNLTGAAIHETKITLVSGSPITNSLVASAAGIMVCDTTSTPNKIYRAVSTAAGDWVLTGDGSGGSPGGSTTELQFNDAGAFNGSSQLRWDNSGNHLKVGGGNVHVGAVAPLEVFHGGVNTVALGITNNADSTFYLSIVNTPAFGVRMRSDTSMFFDVDGDIKMTLKDSGNLGIGTTDPAAKLHVAGSVKIVDGTQGPGKILTDMTGDGSATWEAPSLTGSGVAGQIALWTSGSAVGNDANISWDSANKALLVGGFPTVIPAPFPHIEVTGSGGPSLFISTVYHSGGDSAAYTGFRAGGTQATPAATPLNSGMLSLLAIGHDGTQFDPGNPGGELHFRANQVFGPSAHGTNLLIRLAANGTTALSDVIFATATPTPKVGIGTAAPDTSLHVAGSVKIVDGSEGLEKVLTSDANGLATWAAPVVKTLKFTKTYADFSAAALTNTINLVVLPAGSVVLTAKAKHSAAFTGGTVSDTTVDVGDSDYSAAANELINALNVFNAPADSPTGQKASPGNSLGNTLTTTQLTATVTTVGANIDQLTQGSVDIWISYIVQA